MRKVLAILAVLALTAPVFAASHVDIAVDGAGVISYTVSGDGDGLVGFGIIADTSGGSGLISGAANGDCHDVNIDYAHSNPEGYAIGDGHPAADPGAAGVATVPADVISISAGELDTEADCTSGVLATLECDGGACAGTIAADTLRGGLVDVNGDAMTSNLPVDFNISGDGGGGCACAGDATTTDTATGDGGNGIVNIFDLQLVANTLIPAAPTFSVPTPAGLECYDLTGTDTDPSDGLPGADGTLNIFDLQALANYLIPLTPTFSGGCIE